MQLVCEQYVLARAVALAQRAVSQWSILPTASYLLLAAGEGELRVSGTNLDLALTAVVAARVEQPGELCVPARVFGACISTLGAGPVTIVAGRSALQVRGDNSEANIKHLPSDDFPPIAAIEREVALTVDSEQLRLALEQVLPAVAADDTRPVLSGVCFTARGRRLELAAADGFRLAVRRLELASDGDGELAVIVPRQAAQEMARLLAQHEGQVCLACAPSKGTLHMTTDAAELVTRLIEGTFPDYERLIPTATSTSVVASTEALERAVRRALVFASEVSHHTRLDLEPGRVVVSARSDAGHSSSEVTAELQGEGLRAAFNARYLLDALGAIRSAGEATLLALSTPGAPGVLRPTVGDSYLHLIMPMHVRAGTEHRAEPVGDGD